MKQGVVTYLSPDLTFTMTGLPSELAFRDLSSIRSDTQSGPVNPIRVFKTHSEVGNGLVQVIARMAIPPIPNSVSSSISSDLSFISGGLRFSLITLRNLSTLINVNEAAVVRDYFTYFRVFA